MPAVHFAAEVGHVGGHQHGHAELVVGKWHGAGHTRVVEENSVARLRAR